MRTLTYQPLTGITAETDFNDVSTFYAYDRLGRLAAIRDSEGNIVTAYAYHLGYAGAPAGLNYVRTYTPQVAGIQTQAQLAAALAAGGEAGPAEHGLSGRPGPGRPTGAEGRVCP